MLLAFCALVARASGLAASPQRRLSTNVAGPLYVDESCIDCDTCRWMVPSVFDRRGAQSAGGAQPGDSATWLEAQKAAVACPTGSIRSEEASKEARRARDAFPQKVEGLSNVYHAGFHSPKSFGATPYVVHVGDDVLMVDSPRYSTALAKAIEQRFGAPTYMLLTHVDDVGDHIKWKERFPTMQRVIHHAEVRGPDEWPYIDTRDVEVRLGGGEKDDKDDDKKWHLGDHVVAYHVPGHSKGHLAFLVEEEQALFTGDHLSFSPKLDRIDGMARYGWNLPLQADSIAKLADLNFLHVLPGHGRRISFDDLQQKRDQILHAADAFKSDPYGTH
mmetsp:Transcript_25360/g.82030  ORF Transcript_25360/g.82030 Transcript_25360/m.82030 type:complete len:331 (+) Transcript_25360:965-1957(+)